MNTQLMRNYCLEMITQIFFFFFLLLLFHIDSSAKLLFHFVRFFIPKWLCISLWLRSVFSINFHRYFHFMCFFSYRPISFSVQNTRFSRYDRYEIPMYLYWSKFKCNIYQLVWYGINIILAVYKIIYRSSIFPIP